MECISLIEVTEMINVAVADASVKQRRDEHLGPHSAILVLGPLDLMHVDLSETGVREVAAVVFIWS